MPCLAFKGKRKEQCCRSRPRDSRGCQERAVVTKGENQSQSSINTSRNKHTDLIFCTLAKHSRKPESGESGQCSVWYYTSYPLLQNKLSPHTMASNNKHLLSLTVSVGQDFGSSLSGCYHEIAVQRSVI